VNSERNPKVELQDPLALIVGQGPVLPTKLLGFPDAGTPADRVRVLVLDPRMVDGRYVPLETVRGFIEAGLHLTQQPRWEVGYAAACPGYGPITYEALMEMARRSGDSSWVQPSSVQVSTQAERVWQRFRGRPDVYSRPCNGTHGGTLGCVFHLRRPMKGYTEALDRGRRLTEQIARAQGKSRQQVHSELLRLGPWFFDAAYRRGYGNVCREPDAPEPLLQKIKRVLMR